MRDQASSFRLSICAKLEPCCAGAEEGFETCLAYMRVWVEVDRDLDVMSNEPLRYIVHYSSVAWVNE